MIACCDRKLHPNHITRMVVILDLGLGQCRLLDNRPHHRLRAAIEQAVILELHDLAGNLGFGVEGHGGVGIIPIACDAEALELFALHGEPMFGECAAFFAEFND